MSLRGWEKLTCECGNDNFHQAFQITWHENQGTAAKPNGWACTGCGKRTDVAKLINVAKQVVLQAKIAELEAQRT